MDLALNNQEWLECNKTKPNKTKPTYELDSAITVLLYKDGIGIK